MSKEKILRIVSILITFAAVFSTATASLILWYQPKIPKSIRN